MAGDRSARASAPPRWARCWCSACRSIRLTRSRADRWLRADDRDTRAPRDRCRGLGARRRLGARPHRAAEAARPRCDRVDPAIADAVSKAVPTAQRLDEAEIVRLFAARDADYEHVITAADALRQAVSGDVVRYVVNRNINYTNICYYRCKFCAFSKGKTHEALRGTPYDLDLDEVVRRSREAWDRGATEVCLQGGIHPDYTGATYLGICRAIKAALPEMHVHAFSPLEVTQGAATLGLSLRDFLTRLKDAGLGTLPGTAAEILDDEVRGDHLPRQGQHRAVARGGAHRASARPAHDLDDHVRPRRAPDLLGAPSAARCATCRRETGGFTEFVPLPFVHMEAPMYLRGLARKGPTFREAVLMHAVGAPGAAPADHQHPDVVGEDGAGGRGAVPERRRQRHGRHA